MTSQSNCVKPVVALGTLAVVVLTKNSPALVRHLTQRCVESLFDWFIGDTGTEDPEVLALYDSILNKSLKNWFPSGPLDYHFSKNNNEIARGARTTHLLFLNNDVIFSSGQQISDLYQYHLEAERENPLLCSGLVMNFGEASAGDLSAQGHDPSLPFGGLWKPGLLQHAGIHFSAHPFLMPVHPLAAERSSVDWKVKEFPATTGAALLISRDLFFRVGGFDEGFEKEAQDVDLCLKVHRLGGRSLVWNVGPVIHLENATRPKGEVSNGDRERLLLRWKNYVELSFLDGESSSWPKVGGS